MLKKIFSTFVSNFFVSVFNLLIVILVSQFLGATGKGEQSILITTISFVLLVCNVVGGGTLVYLVPRYNNLKILAISYIWSFIICLLVFLFLNFLSNINQSFIIHIALLSFLNSLFSINLMIFLGKEKIQTRNLIVLIQTILVVLVLLFLFYTTQDSTIFIFIVSLYVAYSVAFATSIFFLIKFLKIKKTFPTQNLSLYKAIFRYGIYNQLSHVTQLLSLRLSFYILLLYVNKESVGVYSVAIALVESVWLICNSIATVQYAKISNSNDKKSDKELTIRLLRLALTFSFCILLLLSLLPSGFYTFLFGADFAEVNKIIIFLSPGVFIYNFIIILGHYFSGQGRYYINTVASSIGLVFSAALTFLLVPNYSYFGAAIAASVSYFITAYYVFYVFKKETEFSILDFVPKFMELKNIFHTLKNLIFSKNEKN